MKRIISKLLIAAALVSSVNAGHFSWGVSIGFGGVVHAPVYCPPPVVYTPVVYHQPQVVVVHQPVVHQVVYHPSVVVMPHPVVYYPPTATIWVGSHHHHGHRR